MRSILMTPRIALLLTVFFVFTGCLISPGARAASAQTAPSAAPAPATPPTTPPASGAPASTPPAATGQTPAPANNSDANSNSDDSVTTLKKTVNEVRVVFTV